MIIYFLPVFFLALFVAVYKKYKDICNPCVLFMLCYFVSTYLLVFYKNKWKVDLDVRTFWIIVIGAIVFMIGTLFGNIFTIRKGSKTSHNRIEMITVSASMTAIIIGINIIYILLILRSVRGSGSLAERIFAQRMANVSDIDSGSMLTNVLGRVSECAVYIYAYAFLNNYIGYRQCDLLLLVPIIPRVLSTLLLGGRMGSFRMIVAFIVMGYIIRRRHDISGDEHLIKEIFKYGSIGLLMVFVFYKLAEFIGRTPNANITDYIARYFSGGVALLNMYIKKPYRETHLFGGETFYYLYKTLYRLGMPIDISSMGNYYLDMRASNGIVLGNVYTAYRRYISDFGYIGMIFFQFIYSLLMTILYKNVKKGKRFIIIVYVYLAWSIILHPVDENFFSSVINPSFLINMGLFYGIYKTVIRYRDM